MKDSQTPNVFEVIDFCKELDLEADLVGQWIWISFDDKPDRELRRTLKDFGFRWSKRRGKWAHNCGHPTKSAYQSDPWEKYDHRMVTGQTVNN